MSKELRSGRYDYTGENNSPHLRKLLKRKEQSYIGHRHRRRHP